MILRNRHKCCRLYRVRKKFATRLTVKIKNGLLLLPPSLKLAEGTSVELVPLVPLPADPPFLKAILKLAKPRDWPIDFALNYGYYTKGHPKK